MFAKLLHPGTAAKRHNETQGVRPSTTVVLLNDTTGSAEAPAPTWVNTRNYISLGWHRTPDGKIKSWEVE